MLRLSVNDSLKQLADSSYRSFRAELRFWTVTKNRLAFGLQPIPYERILEDQLHDDSIAYAELDRRRMFIQSDLDSLRMRSQLDHSFTKIRLFSLDAVIAAIALSLIGFLWTWFGGQQRTQVAPAEASVVPESPPTTGGINWSRVTANPVSRVLGWLLLIFLGLVVLRIGEEVVLAIRSVL
jgi:hypothetical protein